MRARLFCDGACRNPGPAAVAWILTDLEDVEIARATRYIGDATNNVAEYTAIADGLRKSREMGVTHLQVASDSQVVINQLNGDNQVRSENLRRHYRTVRQLAEEFTQITFAHRTRDDPLIRIVDRLAKQMLKRAVSP